ncbi:Tyrosine recombinase XerC [subsurface metagenome]
MTKPWNMAKEYKTRRPIDSLSEEEEKKFEDPENFKSSRNWLLCYLPLKTGLRPGEVLSLDTKDLLYQGEVVRELELRADQTKRSKPRYIPISEQLREILHAYIVGNWPGQQAQEIDHPLFPGATKINRLTIRRYQQIVRKKALDLIGREIHPHIFRHTFATRIMRKAGIKITQRLLGHSTIWTTSIYLHPNKDDLRQAVEE